MIRHRIGAVSRTAHMAEAVMWPRTTEMARRMRRGAGIDGKRRNYDFLQEKQNSAYFDVIKQNPFNPLSQQQKSIRGNGSGRAEIKGQGPGERKG